MCEREWRKRRGRLCHPGPMMIDKRGCEPEEHNIVTLMMIEDGEHTFPSHDRPLLLGHWDREVLSFVDHRVDVVESPDVHLRRRLVFARISLDLLAFAFVERG